MSKNNQLKSLLVGIVIGAGAVLCIGAADVERPAANATWEYRVVSGFTYNVPGRAVLEQLINARVAEGWEFVSASGTGLDSGLAILKKQRK
jgi:hypothetical protein